MAIREAVRRSLLHTYKVIFEPSNARFLTPLEWSQRPIGAYQESLVASFCAARASLFHDTAAASSPLGSGALHLALAALKIGRPASILDFGGGTGNLGLAVRRAFPESVGRYVVIETDPMVAAAGESGLAGVEFTTDMPPDPFDVVMSSGTLQCTPDPLDYLRRLVALGAPQLLLLRNLFARQQKYIRYSAPLFLHGEGPLPHGFENSNVDHFLQTVDFGEAQTIVSTRYDIRFKTANTTGHPMPHSDFIGEDWFCTLR